MILGNRIYVAGSSKERLTVVQPLLARVRAAGYTVTYDWTVEPAYDWPSVSDEHIRGCAERDFEGILAAHVLWYVMPTSLSEGSAAELGAALMKRHFAPLFEVIVSGQMLPSRVFPRLAKVFDDHEAALKYVCGRLSEY